MMVDKHDLCIGVTDEECCKRLSVDWFGGGSYLSTKMQSVYSTAPTELVVQVV